MSFGRDPALALRAQPQEGLVPVGLRSGVKRGYHVFYREDETNHCPGCGRSHWYVGRLSCECAFCATALPRVVPPMSGAGTFWTRGMAA